ncbi:MAG: hypothetical protein K0S33_3094 [Bacteroidetes bacterium]|jgi:hypothetical protein|nr:hypothetical protein [Bacteroidota bacterium]
MNIYIDSTVEELEAKVTALQNVLNENSIDKLYWLEALLPPANGNKDPYKNLPAKEKSEKHEQWHSLRSNKFRGLRNNLLKKILDSFLNEDIDEAMYTAIKPLLTVYLKEDTGPVQYKSALTLEKYSLEEQVVSFLPSLEKTDEKAVYDAFVSLNGFSYQKEISVPVAEQLVSAMQKALTRTFRDHELYFSVFGLLEKLSPQHPQLLAKLQEEITAVLDLKHMDYRDYGSALHLLEKAWEHIQPYWRPENIRTLQDKIIAVAKKESRSFVEDNVLSGLKTIGKDNPEAQEFLENWNKKKKK